MQGIMIVDKPAGWTSFDVIAKLRGVLGTRKLGHSGTLDPMATGVLPVFFGGASKAVDLQLDHTKTYQAVLRLGSRTDTGDITGTVLESRPVTAGEQQLLEVLPRFIGPQMQVPPPTRTEVFRVTPSFLPTRRATVKESRILNRISGSAFTPVPIMSAKLKVAPVRMMPQFKNFLLAKVVPALKSLFRDGIRLQMIMETRRATIGPPITVLPSREPCREVDQVARRPIIRQRAIAPYFFDDA